MPRNASKKAVRKAAPKPATGEKLPRVARGKRVRFFREPGVDQLFGIVTSLSAELWAAFERIDTLEQVLHDAGVTTTDAVERYAPDEQTIARRAAAREAFIQRVFQVLEDYA